MLETVVFDAERATKASSRSRVSFSVFKVHSVSAVVGTMARDVCVG